VKENNGILPSNQPRLKFAFYKITISTSNEKSFNFMNPNLIIEPRKTEDHTSNFPLLFRLGNLMEKEDDVAGSLVSPCAVYIADSYGHVRELIVE